MKKFLLIFTFIFSTLPFLEAETFHLNIDKAIQVGIENNYELKYNKIFQIINKKTIEENFRQFLPSLSLSYANSYSVIPYQTDTRMQSVKFNLTQPLYQGGALYISYKLAKLELLLTKKNYTLLLNNIKIAIQKQYFATIIQQEIVHIQAKLVEHSQLQQKFAEAEHKLGILTAVDLADIQAYTKNSELDYIKSHNQLTKEYNNLKKLLNLDWRVDLKIDESIATNFSYTNLIKPETELIAIAFANRNEILQQYAKLEKAYYTYKKSKYYFLPNIGANFEYSLSGEHFYPFKSDWNFGLQFSFSALGSPATSSVNNAPYLSQKGESFSTSSSLSPFGDIGYIKKYIQAEAEFKSVKIKKQQLKQDIAIEVKTKYTELTETWKLLTILEQREHTLEQRQKIYALKLKLGEVKRSDALKADIEYYKAKVERVKGILQYINSVLDLENSLGLPVGSLNIIKTKKG